MVTRTIHTGQECKPCFFDDKNSSGDEIANVNFLRRYGKYVLQNTDKNSSGDEIANVLVKDDIAHA